MSTDVRTDAEREFHDAHGMWPDDTKAMAYCLCYHSCMEDPRTGCSLSGDWHVHAGEPCPVHPDAPGDR